MAEAMNMALTDVSASNKLWAEVDHMVTDDAPWVSLYSPKQLDFVSKNLKNFSYSYQARMLFSRVAVQ
jgi:peptide/nickel transport system substrate-binding protein